MNNVETRIAIAEEKLAYQQELIELMQESIIELKRQYDDIHQSIHGIQKDVSKIQRVVDQASGLIAGVTKTVLIIATFFSALGATVWAIVDKLAPLLYKFFENGK